jgi:hypothetical protein
VREARAEEAKLVGAQVEDKLAGKAVTGVHSELTNLFEHYDNAVTTAARAIREKYGKRVDILIKNFEGKDMNAILALSDAKKAIEGTVDTPLNAEQRPATANPPASVSRDPVGATSPVGTKAKLSAADKKRIESYFVGKTWKIERNLDTLGFTSKDDHALMLFAKNGKGERKDRDGKVTSELQWNIEDDGTVLVKNCGWYKHITFLGSAEATMLLHVPPPKGDVKYELEATSETIDGVK